MSNRVLRLSDYPGLSPKLTREPYYDVKIQEAISGKEIRSTWWASPRWRHKLTAESLLINANTDELRALVGFFHAHFGALDSWLLDAGESVDGMLFGIGDDSTQAYQLQASDLPAITWGEAYDGEAPRLWPAFGDGFYPIWQPHEITIYADEVEVEQVEEPSDETECKIEFPGVVIFGAPPAAEALLTWSGTYYRRVRFAAQGLPLEQIVPGLWRGGIELIEVKP